MLAIKVMRNWLRTHAIQLRLVRLFAALILVAMTLSAALVRKGAFDWDRSVEAQGPTLVTTPHAPSAILPPADMPPTELNSQASTSAQASTSVQGRQVFIGFDGLPFATPTSSIFENVPLWPLPATQYQDAVFSSDPGYYVVTYGRNYGNPQPGITRAFHGAADHFAPLIVDFPNKANDLSFTILAIDNSGVIATVEIYQHGRWTQNVPLFSPGRSFNLNYTLSFQDITRIIVRVNDPLGLAFDNFRFTVPNPSPSPTPTPAASPTPTPPPDITDLKSKPEENEIDLLWTPSAGAGWYMIERFDEPATGSIGQPASGSAASPEGVTFAPINSTFFCNTAPLCKYEDTDSGAGLSFERDYSYFITPINLAGQGRRSNVVKERPLANACSKQVGSLISGDFSRFGWSMHFETSPDDGLVLSNVALNGKLMANRMSVPYFSLTPRGHARTRGQLTPQATGTTMRSHLISAQPPYTGETNKAAFNVQYAIDHIPGMPKACLTITERFEFYDNGKFTGPTDLPTSPCEPSGLVQPCSKFRPMIDYSITNLDGESLESINIPIRLHFQNTTAQGNTVALARDANSLSELAGTLGGTPGFTKLENPLKKGWWGQVVVPQQVNATKDAISFDNFHQTNKKDAVVLPRIGSPIPIPIPFGCPECVHFHWRWSNLTPGPGFNGGRPIVFSDQTVDIQVGPASATKIDPQDYAKDPVVVGLPLRDPWVNNRPFDVVLWYSPTGFTNSDTFFQHTAWFTKYTVDANKTVALGSAANPSGTPPPGQDGPTSVTFGSVYQSGDTTFDSYNLNTLPPAPPGYAALNNAAYLVKTTAIVSGPNVVTFSVPSVSNQSDFNNLRIFHAEVDPFDPDKAIWVDATILAPDSPAADFSTKTLSAKVEDLGVFVIGKFVQIVPPRGFANLRLTSTDSADPITSGSNLTYTVTIHNDGPETATEVAFKDILSPDVRFVSATPSQGSCKERQGAPYCALGSIVSGAAATVAVVVQPTEGTGSFPPEGKTIVNSAVVRSLEQDSDASNDEVLEQTNVLPSPNKPPIVSITGPTTGTVYAGQVNTSISAVATDSDGSISNVSFFDNDDLIGDGIAAGGNNYTITRSLSPCDTTQQTGPQTSDRENPCGVHTFLAVATDNNGRRNASAPVTVIVNGLATVNITNPVDNALVNPGSNISIVANVTHPSSVINNVEFLVDEQLVGTGVPNGSGQYSFTWNQTDAGAYSIVAVITDGLGIRTRSNPTKITVDTPPTVNITAPVNGTIFPSDTNISLSATAHSTTASVARVDFYANGVLVATSISGFDDFIATWRHLADGFYTLTAVATDDLGLKSTSLPVTIGVNKASPRAGEFIWFDDALPAGAVTHTDDEGWYWVDANPGSFSGTRAHQSRNFAQLDLPFDSLHRHYFDGATMTLPIGSGDKLFTYVFLDINNMPREIMLEWKDTNSWEHRAYWGANRINSGSDGTNSRRYMGPLPRGGSWVRLEVPASAVGLEGTTLDGMAFTLDAGRATWDLSGKASANATPLPTTPPGDSVWIEDDFPAGVIDTSDTVNDQWTWVANPRFSGQRAHQSQVTADHNTLTYRSHAFKVAQTPMQINPSDVLFTYVLIDPSAKADQIMLQWYDGSSWEHRAFWGENFINHLIGGVQGTESQRYMGGVPNAQSGDCGIPDHPGWCRLEVPASYVGLEGKSVTGMAFSIYGKEPTVTWDRSGKADHSNNVFLPLAATAAVYSLRNKTLYAYDMNTRGVPNYPAEGIAFYAHPNQAAATVPFYRFHDFKGKFYYSTCRDCAEQAGWTRDGVAFYVYADGSTPGTVPLYEFHGSETFYYSITPTAPAGMSLDGIVAYVYPNSGLVPAPPSFLRVSGCYLEWRDNAWTETGFKIVSMDSATGVWNQLATVGANVNSFKIGCHPPANNFYIVRAYNSFGDSAYSNAACAQCVYPDADPGNTPPMINIASPANGDVVDHNFAITGNAFDVDGNGTIAKVEFFANGSKVGEVTDPPYVFSWNNAPLGTYSLTATVTDSAGATTTSIPVSITVGVSSQTITFDPIPDKSYGDAPFTVSATASSGLPVTLSIVSGPATISGSTVTITGVGSVTIRASQAGDAYNNAAPDVDLSLNVAKASATITLSNLSQTYDGTAKPVTATTNPVGLSGLSINYNGSATVPTNAGSYSIVASLANGNYTAADATGTLTIGKASETITFNPLANKTYGDPSFAVTASCSSGLPVSFSIVSGPATIAGSTVALNGAGTVTVRASQSGNENYNAATNVDQSFTVAKASATITLTNLNQNYDGTPKTVTATTNPSGLSGISIKYNGSSTVPSNAGSYSVVASLTNDNYSANDATGTLIINAPPTVRITSPTNGTLLHATSISISASAADSDGSVSKVEFFQGSVKLGQVLSAPFDLIWNNVAGGSYSLTAVASDNSGNSTVSTPISITVNNPPNINITASSPQDIPTAPAQISINADAIDADGTISKVDFYQGATLLATDLTSPYSYTWSNVAAGNYSITAKATDNLGGVTTSNVVGISVNAKPNVSLTSPGNGALFIAPGLVSINATASDSDGSISKVEFYQGSTLISSVTASPYSFNWSYVPAGTYTLTAKATDNIGASMTSNSVTITVTPNSVAIGKIAFASNRDGCAQIYLMNTDGTGQTCLSNGASNDESPKWSPDNSHIVFQSDRDFESNTDNPIYGMDIYVMNWDGSAPTRLTYAAYDDGAPVWSPDGNKIAFQSFRNGVNSQIYVMNADGSGQVNVSNSTANDIEPSWSPDGTKIAFVSDRDQAGFSSIYAMNADGSNQTRLTSSGSGFLDEQPAWSPDGMKLAFTTTRDSAVVEWQLDTLRQPKLLINKEVYVMNADGSSQVRLTNIMGNDDSPVWSPDGTKIAFRSDRDRNCCDPSEQVWVMNVDGSNQVNLSNNKFGDYCPSWSR
ncbi:MAG TPA: Ig-like domain-containing protein [Pyrinomonadaceae bacterium]|nr:Ig-like domain-containing protein [Pyrinomonadaceae bacterium]